MKRLLLLLAVVGMLFTACEVAGDADGNNNSSTEQSGANQSGGQNGQENTGEDPVFSIHNDCNLVVEAEGGIFEIDLTTNLEYSVDIPQDAQSWLNIADTRTVRAETLSFFVAENTVEAERSATVRLLGGDNTELENLHFVQKAAATKEEVFVRDTIIKNYIEYRTGNVPIIFSVPHGSTTEGGSIDNVSLIKRTENNMDEKDPSFSTVLDTRTLSLSRKIDEVFFKKTGKHPYIILGKMSRKYVDFNRKRGYGVPKGGTANGVVWDTYHEFVKEARKSVEEKFGLGLLLDIHGHGHSIKRIEAGYMLTTANLNLTDAELLANEAYAEKSSIYNLVQNNKGGYDFVEMLRGTESFGTYLSNSSLPCVPSAKDVSPGTDPYFNGGYITSTYGSSKSARGKVDAIQLEFDSEARLSENLETTANRVVDVVVKFIKKHYDTTALD